MAQSLPTETCSVSCVSSGLTSLTHVHMIHPTSRRPPSFPLHCLSPYGPYLRSLHSLRNSDFSLPCPVSRSSFLFTNQRILGSILYSTQVNTVPMSRLHLILGHRIQHLNIQCTRPTPALSSFWMLQQLSLSITILLCNSTLVFLVPI